jgi:hypothetical protein
MKQRPFTKFLALAAILALPSMAQSEVTPEEARAIAKEAYIYGYPMVDSYRIEYGYFIDKSDPEYKGPENEIHNTPRVYSPADKAIQTPNVWFGPTAPKGHEKNWVQTVPGKGWNVLLRLYGPGEAWFDKTWKPGEFELVE